MLLIFGMYFYKDFYLCYNEIQQRESFWCRLTEQKKKDAGESQNLLLEGKELGIKKCSYYQVIIGRLSQMEGRRFHTPKFMKKEEQYILIYEWLKEQLEGVYHREVLVFPDTTSWSYIFLVQERRHMAEEI